MDRLGIENISVFGLPPVDFVNLAADLGCSYISTALWSMGNSAHGYPMWSLKEDRSLRLEMIAAMSILDALPRERVIGLEVPLRSQAQAGVGPRERLGMCLKATRGLLAQLK